MRGSVSAPWLLEVLKRIRDLRRWAALEHVDPWAVRQGLIIALALDTEAARRRGISREDLEAFDREAQQDASEWVRRQPP